LRVGRVLSGFVFSNLTLAGTLHCALEREFDVNAERFRDPRGSARTASRLVLCPDLEREFDLNVERLRDPRGSALIHPNSFEGLLLGFEIEVEK
jgi:hypothetical protein